MDKKKLLDKIWKLTSKGTAEDFINELPPSATMADANMLLKKWDKEGKLSADARWKISMALEESYSQRYSVLFSGVSKEDSEVLLRHLRKNNSSIRRAYSNISESYVIFEAEGEETKIQIPVDDMNEFTATFSVPPAKADAFKKAIADKIEELVTKELLIDPVPMETDNTIEYSFLSANPAVTVSSLQKTFDAIDNALIVKIYGDIKGSTSDSIGSIVTVNSGENEGKIGQIIEKDPETGGYKINLEDGGQDIFLENGEFTIHAIDLTESAKPEIPQKYIDELSKITDVDIYFDYETGLVTKWRMDYTTRDSFNNRTVAADPITKALRSKLDELGAKNHVASNTTTKGQGRILFSIPQTVKYNA